MKGHEPVYIQPGEKVSCRCDNCVKEFAVEFIAASGIKVYQMMCPFCGAPHQMVSVKTLIPR